MARDLEQDELIDRWTLVADELALVAGKRGATRLGFAVMLRFYTDRGRFPRGRSEIPDAAVEYVARQVGVSATEFAFYEWSGRTIEFHRGQIRRALGFRECGAADADKLTEWLVTTVTQAERGAERVREQLLARCREERIEPPSGGRVDRIVRSALHRGEELLFAQVAARLPESVRARLLTLVTADEDGDDGAEEDGPTVLASIRSEPGNVSLNTMLTEIAKLEAVRAVSLPAGLFADIAPKVVTAWRARAAVESPSHLRDHAPAVMLTLLAALLYCREREITDTLVELLISTVHRINARAEVKVTKELIREFQRVTGKENLLFRVAEATVDAGDRLVRDTVFPVASQQVLRDLVAEFKSSGPTYQRTVKATLKASYTNHYRAGLIKLLDALEFRSNNTTHRPVLDALDLIGRYASAGNLHYYPAGEHIPVHRGLGADWDALVYKTDTRGRRRVVRMVYEVCTFRALRDQLRCKEIWVVGADRWRNPAEDLPTDFEDRRAEHYQALRKPVDPAAFIEEVREEMRTELAALHQALSPCDWLEISDRASGAIKLTPLDAAPEPRNLRRLKQGVQARWGTVPLIDMLKEAVLRTGCLSSVTSVAGHSSLPEHVLAERLLLAIYGYGTNTGIRAVAAGEHGHSEDEIRYARRRYLTTEAARQVAIEIANATFAAREETLWGEGSTAVASDSTHFGAFDQNIFTEWHSRYGGRGVLIYWHVDRGSVVIHSQRLNCSASEVHAMVDGAIGHGTEMQVEANYVDTHGQSEVGFGITKLLGFDLLPRIKRINKVKLYRPTAGEPDLWPGLAPALSRPIRWDHIGEQYDQMVKYEPRIIASDATSEMGVKFQSYDLGRQKRGAVAVVNLSGSAANVRLMNALNFSKFRNGRQHRYVGGLARRSPVRLAIPSDGHWYVTVDLTGLRGTVRSGVVVEPPPLPPLRSSASAPLSNIRHEAPPYVGIDDEQVWDVFISHASEDKAVVGRPLAERLQERGLTVWLDDFELRIGDSLRRKIDAGLAGSRFGVVVLSRSFFAKGWPQYELDGLITRQVSGEQNLLPIWHEITRDEVMAKSPSLADKIARTTAQYTIDEIAQEIADVVRPTVNSDY